MLCRLHAVVRRFANLPGSGGVAMNHLDALRKRAKVSSTHGCRRIVSIASPISSLIADVS
jgi:hypothetical protein